MKFLVCTEGAGAASRPRLGGVRLLACALLLCPGASLARQAATRTTPQAAVRPVPEATTPSAPQAPARTPAAQAPRPSVTATTAPAAPRRPAPPREVVTVVHRLSGWKLLAWLATSGQPAFELDDLPSAADAHTNIVAGYIYEDGRSVVTRLPQAEVELEGMPSPPDAFGFAAAAGSMRKPEPEYTLVTADGRRFEATFVGLDTATGLTLLEANEPLLPGAHVENEGDAEAPVVGQHIRLYAPAPATPPATPAGVAPHADANRIYLNIDQKEGTLTEVRRGPSGKPFRVVASADVPPEWAGAVAAGESGEFVGIVAQSVGGETQIVPLATVRSACDRVLKLRGSAPQPWLGVRGDAASQAPLKTWVSFGWSPELALPHIEKSQGVFLTSVAPGTPAALAGLRPGDLIERVGPREVRSVEDLSQTLREAGVGAVVDITVWRSPETEPVRLPVELKGVNNPALATAFAEQRAAFERMSAVAREMAQGESELQQILTRYPTSPADRAKMELLSARLRDLKLESTGASEQMKAAAARVAAARLSNRGPALPRPFALPTPLQNLGLSTVGLTPRGAAHFGARGGMLVVVVRPETPAAASSLLAGDVIETVNSAPVNGFELMRLLSTPDAAPLTLGVVRKGQRITVSFSPTVNEATPAIAPSPRNMR
jgi:S1-C subfamily serine protease